MLSVIVKLDYLHVFLSSSSHIVALWLVAQLLHELKYNAASQVGQDR